MAITPEEKNVALVVLYRLFRAAWLRHGDLMNKLDRQAEQERMVQLSDVIGMLDKG